jgi:hypothetical protein
MVSFHSFPSYESIASLTVLGSSSIIDKEKFEWKLGGVYLYGCLVSLTDLLNPGIWGSSSSELCPSIESDSSSFNSNSIL